MTTNTIGQASSTTLQGYAELAIKNTYNNSDEIGKIYNQNGNIELRVDAYNGHYPEIKLVDKTSTVNGYQGYIYQNLETKQYYLVHEGSVTPGIGHGSEAIKDYYDNVVKSLASGKPQSQFNDAYSFLKNAVDKYGRNIIQIGQSLGGYHSEVFGATDEFKDIQTYTFNAVGPGSSIDAIEGFLKQHNLSLSNDFSNIKNYRYNNEFVSQIAPHFGEMYTTDFNSSRLDALHNMEVYTENGEALIFYLDDDFMTISELIPSGYELALSLSTEGGMLIVALAATGGSIAGGGGAGLGSAAAALGLIMSIINGTYNGGTHQGSTTLKGYISMDEELYEIQPGDTVWGICNNYDIDLEELLRLNPWLSDRFSKDGKFALIRPGEKLKLPGGGSALLSSGKPSPDIPFNEADKAGIPGVDPILIDLNNDGKISTVGVEDGIYFDHGNDGFAESSAWVSSKDGILAIDKNNDGIINNGNEVFGDNIISIDFVNNRYNVKYNNNLDNILNLNAV